MKTTTLFGLSAAACAMAASLVVGERAVSRQAAPGKVTVTYWEKWTGQEGEDMKKAVEAFNASQDKVFVRYLSISGVDTKTMLATSGGNPPDIAGIWLDQLVQFADANALTDLTQMASAAGIKDSDYIPSFYDGLVYKQKLWALPSTPATICLYVRKDLIPERYRSVETFPKTISEFDKLMFSLGEKSADGGIKRAGFLPSSPGWYNWGWLLFFGGGMVKDGEIDLTNERNVKAFEWVQSYAKQYGASSISSFQGSFGNFASPQDPFMEGKTVCEENGPWKASYINIYHKGLPWFSAPFPYPDDRPDLANHAFINEDILVVPAGAKHPKEAFEFVRFLQRQEVMEKLCSAHGKNSPLAKVSPEFYKNHPNPDIATFDRIARSKSCAGPPQIGIWPQLKSEIDVAFQEVNTAQKPAAQALKDAESRSSKLWATYRKQILAEGK